MINIGATAGAVICLIDLWFLCCFVHTISAEAGEAENFTVFPVLGAFTHYSRWLPPTARNHIRKISWISLFCSVFQFVAFHKQVAPDTNHVQLFIKKLNWFRYFDFVHMQVPAMVALLQFIDTSAVGDIIAVNLRLVFNYDLNVMTWMLHNLLREPPLFIFKLLGYPWWCRTSMDFWVTDRSMEE